MQHEFASVTRAPVPGQAGPSRLAREPGRPGAAGGRGAGVFVTLVATDAGVAVAASVLSGSTAAAAAVRAAALVLAFALAGLYRPRLRLAVLDDLPQILLGVALTVPLGAWLPVPSLLTPPGLAGAPLAWPLLLAAAALVGRATAHGAVHRRRRRRPGVPTVVIGSGDVAARLAEALCADPTYGLAPIGLVGPPPVTEPEFAAPLLGPIDDLDALLDRHGPRAVVVAFPGPPDGDLVGTLRRCRRAGTVVYLVPRLFELSLGGRVDLVHGIPLVRMRPEPAGRWCRALKRAIDVCGAAAGLVLLAPVFAACALAVRWESGRAGVVFRQERITRDGKPFTIVKFRSLTPVSEHESQMRWNISRDDRVGPVGRLLRGTSLDELPQLFNVLRGDMSLVGPRPERPFFVEQFTRAYSGYMDRHRVPAGITGWAQIHGLRGDTSIEDRVRFDNYYIENWSLGLDLKIMIRTLGSMLGIARR